jgi:cytochrome c553
MKNSKQKHVIITLILSGLLFAAVIPACKIYYNTPSIAYNAAVNNEQVQEGKRLTMMMCAGCHYDESTGNKQ